MSDQAINFIPNDDFRSASESDFSEIDGKLYADEDLPDPQMAGAAESFLLAVEQSRVLSVEGERFLFKRLNFLRFRASALQATLTGKRKSKKTHKEIDRLLAEANATREQIARANLRLVMSIVRKLARSSDEFDEFVAEANAILLYAIDKFDYARGYRFSTYATHAVQRHTFRLVERQSKRRQRELSDSELVQSTAAASEVVQSENSSEEVQTAVNELIAGLSESLDEREEFIVRSRFGLNESGKGMSLRAIGDEIGISKERVRQLLQQSVEKLAESAKPLESILEQF